MARQARWAAVALVAFALAACSSAPVVKPDPPAGACRAISMVGPTTEELARPVDCAADHTAETVYSGTFDGSELPDRPDDAGLVGAEKRCDEQATAKLGAQWRDYRLELHLTWPAEDDWRAGQRWYHCDAIERAEVVGAARARTAPLSAGLTALRVGCMEIGVKSEEITADVDVLGIDCAKPHNAEYAGSLAGGWTQSVLRTAKDRAGVRDGCLGLVASFLGVADAGRYRALPVPIPSTGGSEGALGYRCMLWLGSATMTGSAKGQGTKVPGWA